MKNAKLLWITVSHRSLVVAATKSFYFSGKLQEIRRRQAGCYADNKDMEVVINKEIMKLKFEDKDFEQLSKTIQYTALITMQIGWKGQHGVDL